MLAVSPQGCLSTHYLGSTHCTDSADTSLGPTAGKVKTLSGLESHGHHFALTPSTLVLAGGDAGQVFGEHVPIFQYPANFK